MLERESSSTPRRGLAKGLDRVLRYTKKFWRLKHVENLGNRMGRGGIHKVKCGGALGSSSRATYEI